MIEKVQTSRLLRRRIVPTVFTGPAEWLTFRKITYMLIEPEFKNKDSLLRYEEIDKIGFGDNWAVI